MDDTVLGPPDILLREDRRGVSPVIAVILLVAITVILASVLYLMVAGLFTPHNTTANYLGVNLSQSGNSAEWILSITSMSGNILQNDTTLTLVNTGGGTAFAATTLFLLEKVKNGVQYVPETWGPPAVSVGDRVVISETGYPAGTVFEFVGGTGVLATATLR